MSLLRAIAWRLRGEPVKAGEVPVRLATRLCQFWAPNRVVASEDAQVLGVVEHDRHAFGLVVLEPVFLTGLSRARDVACVRDYGEAPSGFHYVGTVTEPRAHGNETPTRHHVFVGPIREE